LLLDSRYFLATYIPVAYSQNENIPIENISTENIPIEKIPAENIPAANIPVLKLSDAKKPEANWSASRSGKPAMF